MYGWMKNDNDDYYDEDEYYELLDLTPLTLYEEEDYDDEDEYYEYTTRLDAYDEDYEEW